MYKTVPAMEQGKNACTGKFQKGDRFVQYGFHLEQILNSRKVLIYQRFLEVVQVFKHKTLYLLNISMLSSYMGYK